MSRGLWFEDDDGEFKGPVVEIWQAPATKEGRSLFVFGEKADGQRFFGSFFEPALESADSETVEW